MLDGPVLREITMVTPKFFEFFNALSKNNNRGMIIGV